MKRVSLDLHDFSILNNRFDLLLKLKEFHPNCKISLFTIPYDIKLETASNQGIYRAEALEILKANLDWLQIIPHGLSHMGPEMEKVDYTTFKHGVIPSIDEVFTRDQLPYEKGFCAPHWLWTEGVVKALSDSDWWGAVDRNQPDMLRPKRSYTYSHSIDQPFFWSNDEVLKLHGHIDGQSPNDLERCILNLVKLPTDVEWHFVTDFIDDTPQKS